MHSTLPFTLLLSSLLFYTSTAAQAATQQQICANACAVTDACKSQCSPSAGGDVDAKYEAFITCECQSGCLCNAEICSQCCEAAASAALGVTGPASCEGLVQLNALDVLSDCALVSWPSSFLDACEEASGGGEGPRAGKSFVLSLYLAGLFAGCQY